MTTTSRSYIKENPDAPIEAVSNWDYEGVVSLPGHYFNNEDVGLRDAFNDCYSELKTSGGMAKILDEWGFNPDTIPEPGPGFPPGFPEARPEHRQEGPRRPPHGSFVVPAADGADTGDVTD